MNLANKITVARMMLIPFFFLFLQTYPSWLTERIPALTFINTYGLYIATAIFILAAATDKLDGYIARKYNMITNIGKLLDPLADKLLISVALIMLVQKHMLPSWVAFIIIARELVITALRIVASARQIALAADRYGKMKLVLQVVAIVAVLLDNYPFQLVMDIRIDYFIMLAAVVITIYSGYNYIRHNYVRLELNS